MIFFFLLFSSLILLSGSFLLTTVNPLHGIISLISMFVNSALILIVLDAEFLAFIFIIIYVGAIRVPFLFRIMLLNLRAITVKEHPYKPLIIVSVIATLFLFFYMVTVSKNSYSLLPVPLYTDVVNIFYAQSNISVFHLLYSQWALGFLLSGIILIFSLISAVILSLKQEVRMNRQNAYHQIARDVFRTVLLVKDSIRK